MRPPVKGDPAGDNGDLYDAMGYVRTSVRRSGLTRIRNAGSPPAAAAVAAR